MRFLAAGFRFLRYLRDPTSSRQPLILALAAFMTQTNPSWFTLTVLPFLIRLADETSSTTYLSQTIPALATGHAIRSLFSTWGLLVSTPQVVGAQAIFSTAIATVVAILPRLWQMIPSLGETGGVSSGLLEGLAFGLWWATALAGVVQFSPFGRYGIPSLTGNETPVLTWLTRMAGSTGMDIVSGMMAYTLSTLSRQINWDNAADQPMTENTPLLPARKHRRRLTYEMSGRRFFTWKRMTIASILSATLSLPSSSITNLGSPLSEITPVHIGCIPTGPNVTLDDLVYEASTLGSSADLVLFPETALTLLDENTARDEAITEFMWKVARQYGNRILLGLESNEEGQWKNEVVLIDRLGEVDSYEKQRLVPFVEYRFGSGRISSPVWNIDLTTPKGVNKTTWAPEMPRTRTLRVSPLICLDTLHPGLIETSLDFPDLIVISASAPVSLSDQIILHAQQLSATYGTPSFVCSSQGSLSGYIDAYGRILHLQKGGKAFVVEIAIPHGAGRRRRTMWEVLGSKGVLAAGWAILALIKAGQAESGKIETGLRNLIEPISIGFQKLVGWRDGVDEAGLVDLERGSSPLGSESIDSLDGKTHLGTSKTSGSSSLRLDSETSSCGGGTEASLL